jgi:hypothetical protein
MKPKNSKPYNPDIELAKGATLDASSYDKTQKIKVTAAKVTVGGLPGRAEISGTATGRHDASIDGTTDHVAGWNIMLPLTAGQTAAATAKAFADYINTGSRPYRAAATGGKDTATLKIIFTVE